MIQFFVLVAVALGIASTLAISAVQKTRQIGILKAMGMRDRQSGRMFLWQALILGVSGAAVGVAAGLGLIALFSFLAQLRVAVPDHAAGGLHRHLVRRRRAGRGGLVAHPVAAHVEARPDRGDPGWLRRWSTPRRSARRTATAVKTVALHGVSFEIEAGEFASVIGQSGSGKSTLLNLIGLLDTPTAGRIVLNGHDARRRAASSAPPCATSSSGSCSSSTTCCPSSPCSRTS